MVVLASLLLGASPATDTFATAITSVNSTVDSDDLDVLAANATCDLREAILAANSNSTVGQCVYTSTPPSTFDTIRFAIPGAGVHRITVVAPLPEITSTVRIDGFSQPGATCSPRNLLVELHGAGLEADALVFDGAHASEVKGLVINGFAGAAIAAAGIENFVLDCSHIGTNAAGTAAIPNDYGVNVGLGATVGVTGPNVISGNVVHQVGVFGAALLQGNHIGANLAGNAAIGGGAGVSFPAEFEFDLEAQVGSTNPADANLISGLDGPAILVDAPVTVSILFNIIGPSRDGSAILGNDDGVVVLDPGANVRLARNRIAGNTGLGIDLLDDGVTINDAGDADTGPNSLQDYPVIALASPALLTGNTGGFAPGMYTVELFHSPVCHPSGHGEGLTFLHAFDLAHDSVFSFDGSEQSPAFELPHYGVITATATNANGQTSEFSECSRVTLDVDCDGDTTPLDALAILNTLAGLAANPSPVAPCTADVDATSGVALSDALAIRRRVAALD